MPENRSLKQILNSFWMWLIVYGVGGVYTPRSAFAVVIAYNTTEMPSNIKNGIKKIIAMKRPFIQIIRFMYPNALRKILYFMEAYK